MAKTSEALERLRGGQASGWKPILSVASTATRRCRSRHHRVTVEPDLVREGVRAETEGFPGRLADVLRHQGASVRGRPDIRGRTTRSRMVVEVIDDLVSRRGRSSRRNLSGLLLRRSCGSRSLQWMHVGIDGPRIRDAYRHLVPRRRVTPAGDPVRGIRPKGRVACGVFRRGHTAAFLRPQGPDAGDRDRRRASRRGGVSTP